MMMVPKRWAKTDIEQILRSKGCTIKRLLMRVDRFTFMNAIMCFVELGSEAEATKAIKELNGFEAQGKSLVVKPLKADFSWEKSEQRKDGAFGSRYFIDEGTAAYDAMRPLLEHRRIVLSVETPGWSTNKRFAVAVQNAETIIERQFGKYGIESVSGMSRFDRGKTHEPNLLCLVDFRTKEGAEKAVNNHHDTQIEGRLTWLRPAQPSSWRIHQIQKVVGPEALKALQESGVVPEGKEVYEDKFANPRPKRQKRQERQ
ncbi:unnamed protein product [Alternaria burnsii]|nr:unnamed protein product [Alternaria burnsii]